MMGDMTTDVATPEQVDRDHWSLRWDDDDASHPTDLTDILEIVRDRREKPDASKPVGWVNLERSQGDQLAQLADDLHLDDEALEDLTGPMERAKLDVGPDVALVVTRGVTFDAYTCELKTYPVSAVVSAGVLITVADAGPFLKDFNQRVTKRKGDITAGHLLYEVLDHIVDGYGTAYEQIADTVDELAERVFEDRPLTRGEQIRAIHLRRTLTIMRKISMPMREVTTALANAAKSTEDTVENPDWIVGQLAPSTARGYFDVADHVAHISEGVDGLREVMTTLIETNLSLADVRLNTVMKKLASWAALIAVPTLITGFMGMNVPYPGFGTKWGVIGAVVVMIVAVSWLMVMFRRRDWL
jgi:magnesium transporter